MTLVVGHRGSSEGVEPGTLAAYAAALDAGAEMVEVDVRLVAGELLALHDEPAGEVAATRVLDVAALVAERGAALMLDLKETGRELEALAAVLELLPPERLVVSTLEDVSVARLRRGRPEIETGLSIGREWRRPYVRSRLGEAFPAARARACGASFLSVNRRLVPTGILRRAPLPVFLWTVDADRELRRYLRDGRLRGLITNRPGRALELRRDGR